MVTKLHLNYRCSIDGNWILILVASIVYSHIKAPREATGDNWDGLGRTLEWSTASAIPPKYNFAITPDWNDYDTFVDMKEHGRHYLDNHNYKDIHMPNNTPVGFWMGTRIFQIVSLLLPSSSLLQKFAETEARLREARIKERRL